MRMRHSTLSGGLRWESASEDGSGKLDWRTAHERAGETGSPTLFLPETCKKCAHIATEVEEDPSQTLAERLIQEGLSRGTA